MFDAEPTRLTGILRKAVVEADPSLVFDTLQNAAFSAFLVGQHAARVMLRNEADANGAKGTIIFTNASAALKGSHPARPLQWHVRQSQHLREAWQEN